MIGKPPTPVQCNKCHYHCPTQSYGMIGTPCATFTFGDCTGTFALYDKHTAALST